jgi:ABC-2 type transport system ATP-binding protein
LPAGAGRTPPFELVFWTVPASLRAVPVIEVSGLTKAFRTAQKAPGLAGALKGLFRREYTTVTAVKDIAFTVEEGEFVGFLGPNGAGKTTTLKMLSGLLYPTGGRASVLGFTPWERKDGYRRQFALLLGQKNQLWWDLPARESLELNARIYGLPPAEFRRTVDELSELLNVRDKLTTAVRELSLGERMKCELIAALLHQPKVLFLDEPTIGLDVVSAQVVREFLRRHNRTRRTTILLTSHYMADIEALCERVIIVDHGKIFFDGRLAEILGRFAGHKVVTLRFDTALANAGGDPARFGEVIELKPDSLKLKVPRDRVIPAVKALLDELPVKDFSVEEVPVEDVIRQLFDRERTPAPPTPAAD